MSSVDDLLTRLRTGSDRQQAVLAAVQQRFAVSPCQFGLLLEHLDESDKIILRLRQSPAQEAKRQLETWEMRHWLAMNSLRALVREGILGCKKCAYCARYTSRTHLCSITIKPPTLKEQ